MMLSRVFAPTLLIAAGISLVACNKLQTENSSALDATTYVSGISPEFAAAKVVFTQACSACHGFQSFTIEQFKAGGYVVVGDVNNSRIYSSIQGSGGPGPKTMPMQGTITAQQLQTILTWVQSVQ